MGKLFTLISAILTAISSAFAANPTGYEWWFDNDISSLQTGSLSPEKTDLIIDTSHLPKGAHYFNCRLNTDEGEYGSVYRKMFFSLGQDTGEITYEYWFDNDYSGKIVGDISSGTSSFEVNVANLTPGVHYFNCRLSRGADEWGAVYRKMVFTTPTGSDGVAYEYWLDDNYDAKKEGDLVAGANTYIVDLAGLKKGLHRFNYRIKTGLGEWGSVFSKYFYYKSSSSLPFTSYEYWLDNDYAHRVSGKATTNPVTFDINLDGFDKSGGAHYFTMRVRDDDGDWSSFYRRLVIFHDAESKVPVIGYRHFINDTDLGYVKVERKITDNYTFLIALPDSMRMSVKDKKPIFHGDKISLEGTDSLHYIMQIQSELGWAPPQEWDLEVSNPFTTTAVEMAVNTMHKFDTPRIGQFAAAKFTASAGQPLYLRANAKIAVDLYRNGEKVMEIKPDELYGMKQLALPTGDYYAILRDAEPGSAMTFTLHVMNSPNIVPNPAILFNNGEVTITQSREDAMTYYTIEDYLHTTPVIPSESSTRYTGVPFTLDHNGVIRARSIVPGSDIEPSGVEQLVIDSYKVRAPTVRFEHLTVVISGAGLSGVKTFYTLDGKTPELTAESALATGPEGLRPAAGTYEYTGPFSLSGNTTVKARSFKVGYTPSDAATYTYTHSTYITGAPQITMNGTTVTLKATTAGSTLWYNIGNSDPTQMKTYTAPFTMEGNGTIYAQARKTDMYDSEMVSLVINGRQMPKPQIHYSSNMVSLTCAKDAKIYYTLDESAPSTNISGTSSKLYDGKAFEFDRNGVVKAIAVDVAGNLDNSDIAELVIDDHKVTSPSISFEHLQVVIRPDTRSGVRTFYTLSGQAPQVNEATMIPGTGTYEYTAPFSYMQSGRIVARSYRSGYHPSDISEYSHTHSAYITAAPQITMDGTTVTLKSATSGATLWYNIGNSDPTQMKAYTAPFTMEGNGTIYAQARKTDMYDSEVVSLVVSGRKMPKPQINYAGNMVSMTCAKDAKIYYTLDESAPSTNITGTLSKLYDGTPFEFDRNGVVKAIAVDVGGNLDNSDIAELVIDDHKVTSPSISFEHLQVVIRPDTRSDVRTFYTINGQAPQVNEATMTPGTGTYEYTAPFSYMQSGRIVARSYRSGYHPSDLAEYIHSHESYVVPSPSISVNGSRVTISAAIPGSTLWYSIGGNGDEESLRPYTGEFTVDGNLTVYAQARKTDMYNSPVVSRQVTGLQADLPDGVFDFERKLLTLTCTTTGSRILYAINQATNWQTYTAPLHIEGNCVVYAKAEAPNYLDSDIAAITVSEFKCEGVRISYNGRYVLLETDEPDADIRYSLDGTNPVGGATYSGAFDAGGLRKVRAVVIKDAFMNSDVAELELTAYGDETRAETSETGVLSDAFGWTEAGFLDSLTRYRVEGLLGPDDYTLLRGMSQLRHLDIENVNVAGIPDGAFSSMENLVSVSMPRDIAEVGDRIFKNDRQLSAVIWNCSDIKADSRLFADVENPNLLLYLNGEAQADSDLGGIVRNIITNERAGDIVLTDGMPFNAPREFTAGTISYTRSFPKVTPIGDCGGWETLTLPFDVETIKDAQSEIVPFAASGDDNRPFWLYGPVPSGWTREARIMAYRPYLLAMPNNPDYIESFNIRGDVTFSATNATVGVTPEPDELTGVFPFRNGSYMVPDYEHLPGADTRWIVNDEQDGGNLPGSVFVSNLRDVKPFECYLDYESATARMPIFDTSDLETVMGELGTRIWCENHDICILSGISQRLRIFDTMGQLVSIAKVESGVECRVHDLAPGIYIVGRTKIMVR